MNRWLPLIALFTALVHLGAVWLMPRGGWVESVYAARVYPTSAPVIVFIPNLLPFSIASLLIATLALAPGALLVRRYRQLRLGRLETRWSVLARTAGDVAILATIVLHAFFVFWGYNYLRLPLAERLALPDVSEDESARFATAKRAIERVNASHIAIPAWRTDELEPLLDDALARTVRQLEGRDLPARTRIKPPLPKALLAWFGVRGVISPWTLEAHVDPGLPPVVYAFTAAHEKAHVAGFATEREANFVAWLALTTSDDPRLRYAGHFGVCHWFMGSGVKLSEPVLADLRRARDYHRARVSKVLEKGQRKVYRVYLQANRVKAGLGDYRAVARLIHRWEQRGAPRPRSPAPTTRR